MSYPEFRDHIFEALEGILPQGVTIKQVSVEKLNGCIRHGIAFDREEVNFSPTIYLEPFYSAFRKGADMEYLAEELLRCFREESMSIPPDIRRLESFETAKEQIFCKLICADRNRHLLEDTPHREFLDFAIVAYFGTEDEEIGRGSVLLKDFYPQYWGIDADILLDWAIEHTREQREMSLRPMTDVVSGYLSSEEADLLRERGDEMYVLTTKDKYLGAVLVYYPEVLHRASEVLKGDYYLLPSSIHEWILLPKKYAAEEARLYQMVQDVNATEVSEEEILSGNVYYYSAISQKIYICNSTND